MAYSVAAAASVAEDSGATKAGVRAYVSFTVRITSRFTTRPVTSLDTLLTPRRPSSASVAGYARVTSRRYTFLYTSCGSCAVTSTATRVSPSRSSRSRLTALLSSSTVLTRTACARLSITVGITRTLSTS